MAARRAGALNNAVAFVTNGTEAAPGAAHARTGARSRVGSIHVVHNILPTRARRIQRHHRPLSTEVANGAHVTLIVTGLSLVVVCWARCWLHGSLLAFVAPWALDARRHAGPTHAWVVRSRWARMHDATDAIVAFTTGTAACRIPLMGRKGRVSTVTSEARLRKAVNGCQAQHGHSGSCGLPARQRLKSTMFLQNDATMHHATWHVKPMRSRECKEHRPPDIDGAVYRGALLEPQPAAILNNQKRRSCDGFSMSKCHVDQTKHEEVTHTKRTSVKEKVGAASGTLERELIRLSGIHAPVELFEKRIGDAVRWRGQVNMTDLCVIQPVGQLFSGGIRWR